MLVSSYFLVGPQEPIRLGKKNDGFVSGPSVRNRMISFVVAVKCRSMPVGSMLFFGIFYIGQSPDVFNNHQ